jgi:hypothetical protein
MKLVFKYYSHSKQEHLISERANYQKIIIIIKNKYQKEQAHRAKLSAKANFTNECNALWNRVLQETGTKKNNN